MKLAIRFYFFTVLISFNPLLAFSYDVVVDGIYYNLQETTAEVTYYTNKGGGNKSIYFGVITIPESIVNNGTTYRVTSIGYDVFYGSYLTGIVIPSTVINIGSDAFKNCTNLSSISLLSKNVTSFGRNVMSGTEWLNNQPDGLIYIGNIVYGYKGLILEEQCIEIKEGTICIAGGAFSNCKNIVSVKIPNSVIAINEYAFADCHDLGNTSAQCCL